MDSKLYSELIQWPSWGGGLPVCPGNIMLRVSEVFFFFFGLLFFLFVSATEWDDMKNNLMFQKDQQ